jgi:HSP20 family protein
LEPTDTKTIDQLYEMKQRMEVLFSKSFGTEKETSDLTEASRASISWAPSMDVWESANEWVLLADLPGVADEDLWVELLGNKLTVRGNRRTSALGEEVKPVQLQRSEGAFSQTFSVPGDIRADAITAELRHGVLTITVPKGPGSQRSLHKVQVQAA